MNRNNASLKVEHTKNNNITLDNDNFIIKKFNTYNAKHKNVFNQEKTLKEEDGNNFDIILKKSKTLVFERNISRKRFKHVLETIHEVSNSKIDSSELSENEEEFNKINDSNG